MARFEVGDVLEMGIKFRYTEAKEPAMPLILEPLRLSLNSLHRRLSEIPAHKKASPTLKETLQVG